MSVAAAIADVVHFEDSESVGEKAATGVAPRRRQRERARVVDVEAVTLPENIERKSHATMLDH